MLRSHIDTLQGFNTSRGARAAAFLFVCVCLCVYARSGFAQTTDASNASTGAGSQASTSQVIEQDAMGDLIVHALSLIGVRYKYGGNTVEGFDCSGFVRHLFQSTFQFELPRSAREISNVGSEISVDELMPGDLVFYNTLRRQFSHVGIYIGEGRFVHAPSRGKSVEIVEMKDRYWQKRFNGARRLVSVVSALDPVGPLKKITRAESAPASTP